MTEIKLDLDALDPKPYLVHLCGQPIEVFPPKLKALVNLTKVVQSLKGDDPLSAVEALLEALYPIIPDLKKDGIDVNMVQLLQIVELVQQIATPETPVPENVEKVELPDETAEKKTELELSDQSPTS